MIQRLRLYYLHDIDLYYLYFTKGFSIYKAFRQSLRNFENGSNEKLNVEKIDELGDMTGKGMITITLRLDDVKDADICKLLMKVRPGSRNFFVKTILRRYIKSKALDEIIFRRTDVNVPWEYPKEEEKEILITEKPEREKQKAPTYKKEKIEKPVVVQKKPPAAEKTPNVIENDSSVGDTLFDMINSMSL